MSKDRSYPTGKQHKKGKGKRVVAAPTQSPPQPKPAPAKPGFLGKPAAQPLRPPQQVQRPPAQPVTRPAARPAPVEQAAVPQWSITLEAGLYALLAIIAFAVRLYALDRLPLLENEGVRAWAAYGLYRGLPDASLAGQPPLAVFAAMLSFLLFGVSDAAARLLPALAGGLCVLLPYALRRDLGRVAALLAAALLALGPTFLLASRSVDGAMAVAGGALVLLACALAYRRSEERRYVYIAAVAIGVMFAADATAGPVVLILGLLAIIAWLRSDIERDLPREALRNAVLLFIAIAVVLGTGLLSTMQGVQTALVDPVAVWLTGSGAGTLLERAAFYSQVLLAYEPLVVVFSLIAIVAALAGLLRGGGFRLALSRREATEEEVEPEDEEGEAGESESGEFPLAPYLAAWSVLALAFFVLLGDQSPASVVQVILPMSLLAAHFSGRLVESGDLAAGGRDLWLLAFVIILIAFAAVASLNPTNLFGGRFISLERLIQNATTLMLIVVVIAMVAIAAWFARRLQLSGPLLALASAIFVVLAVYTVHTAWQLNLVARANATEPLVPRMTAEDVRTLVADAVAVSRQQGDDAVAITLDNRIGQPARWYLRQFTKLTTEQTGAQTKSTIVIVPAGAKDAMSKSLGRAYVSQRYRLRSTWQAAAPLLSWLRWAHVREPISPLVSDDIIAFYKLPQ